MVRNWIEADFTRLFPEPEGPTILFVLLALLPYHRTWPISTHSQHNDVLRRNGRLRHAKPIEQTHLTNRLVVSCVRGGKREESASEQDQSRLSRELPVAAGFGAMTGRYTPGSTSSLQHESPRLRFKRELRVKFLQKAPTEIVGPKSLKITANGSTVQVAAVDNGHSSHDFTMVNSN
ncbi:hypothetical protein M404DRAFT_598569 [Pisolithus tinctorius Marx 270]|uniref:Uncharacterized protein n=1 Tax=Pisolithus tinctorius Marx 270 TaxID=870435 RepID=A0A0C3J4L2_PISTI|nr:hypothetical protein M404DRAFT_598569 [Pisolithus tinctorius Marx 270]